jgi:hypothetical protein
LGWPGDELYAVMQEVENGADRLFRGSGKLGPRPIR